MSVQYSNDFNAMVSQIKSGVSGPTDFTLQQLLDQAFNTISGLTQQQIQILSYADGVTDGWNTTTGMNVATLMSFGISEGTANAIIAITGQLLILVQEPLENRQTTFDASISDYKTIESGFGSSDLSWYYNTVASALIKDEREVFETQEKFFSLITPYRPPIIVPVTDSDLLDLPFPSGASLNLYRSNVWKIQQEIPYYNDDNNEARIWKNLPATNVIEREPLFALLTQMQGFTGNPLNDSKFIAGVNLMKEKAHQVNSYAVLKGRDYDDLRWMYDGAEQTISLVAAINHTEIQQSILKKFSDVARNTTITSYSAIEAQLQQSVIPGLELNFSAALTSLCMFAKINLQSPGFISKDQAQQFLKNTYKLSNLPNFIFSGIGIELQDLVEMPQEALALTDFQLTPEISLSRSELITLAGIGVTLLATFVVFNVTNKRTAAGTEAVAEAFNAVKTIIVDVAVSGVVLTVLVETALIYSKTGSVGGTIGQILADGVILFVDVLEDLFEDLWNALKGEWAKFIAAIGGAAAVVAGGEAIIGTDLIAGSTEIAAGESAEGAEIAVGEVSEGAEQEVGDILEGFEQIF